MCWRDQAKATDIQYLFGYVISANASFLFSAFSSYLVVQGFLDTLINTETLSHLLSKALPKWDMAFLTATVLFFFFFLWFSEAGIVLSACRWKRWGWEWSDDLSSALVSHENSPVSVTISHALRVIVECMYHNHMGICFNLKLLSTFVFRF